MKKSKINVYSEKSPSLTFYPEIKSWIKKYNLNLTNTNTELGWIASPTKHENWNFTLENPDEFVERLKNIYGLTCDKNIFNKKGIEIYHRSLEDIEDCRKKVKKLEEILPNEFDYYKNPENSYFAICGIKVPERNFLYVEYKFLDRELKENYKISDMRPRVNQSWEFIPLNDFDFES